MHVLHQTVVLKVMFARLKVAAGQSGLGPRGGVAQRRVYELCGACGCAQRVPAWFYSAFVELSKLTYLGLVIMTKPGSETACLHV
jgi:hypothetical protein